MVPELRKVVPGLTAVVGCSSAGAMGMQSKGRVVEVRRLITLYVGAGPTYVRVLLVSVTTPEHWVVFNYSVVEPATCSWVEALLRTGWRTPPAMYAIVSNAVALFCSFRRLIDGCLRLSLLCPAWCLYFPDRKQAMLGADPGHFARGEGPTVLSRRHGRA